MKHLMTAGLIAIWSASTALAACPASPPVSINTQSQDKNVDAAWLEKTLGGKKLSYGGSGTESYRSDGSYSYSEGGQTWSANTYKFYNDGTRCIGYEPNPRFDRYVVRDKKLVLININGGRYEGTLKK